MRQILLILSALTLSIPACAAFEGELTAVSDLGSAAMLAQVPKLYGDDSLPGVPATVGPGELKAIYYEALDYKGSPTRAYAWLGIPAGASAEKPVPGIVLVQGGGGTAFKEWVELWIARGYAAISIAVEGQTDARAGDKKWVQHAMPGPARVGIYGDSEVKPITDQWMYHAVADTVLANSLLRSLPEVDPDRVGITGISWGGVIVSTVIGIDTRFRFAIPVYGCGHLYDSENQYGRALGNNELYKRVWDPMVRIHKATMPVLWLSWPQDAHFALDKQAATYTAAPGPRMVSLIPGMKHSHPAGWRPLDSYAFADSIINDGRPWCRQDDLNLDGDQAVVRFTSLKPLIEARLISTSDSGFTGERNWVESAARLVDNQDGSYTASARLAAGTTGWFINVLSESLVASSDYQENSEPAGGR